MPPLLGTLLLVAGAFVLLCVRADGPIRLIGLLLLGGFRVLTGGVLVVSAQEPFRFHIGSTA